MTGRRATAGARLPFLFAIIPAHEGHSRFAGMDYVNHLMLEASAVKKHDF